jgi:hypothetical protein
MWNGKSDVLVGPAHTRFPEGPSTSLRYAQGERILAMYCRNALRLRCAQGKRFLAIY